MSPHTASWCRFFLYVHQPPYHTNWPRQELLSKIPSPCQNANSRSSLQRFPLLPQRLEVTLVLSPTCCVILPFLLSFFPCSRIPRSSGQEEDPMVMSCIFSYLFIHQIFIKYIYSRQYTRQCYSIPDFSHLYFRVKVGLYFSSLLKNISIKT